MHKILLLSLLMLAAVGAYAESPPAAKSLVSSAPAGASVYFIAPVNGATVSSPVSVRFGLRGMGVAPAGIEFADSGHHHLLINVDKLPAAGQPIPADDSHRHFGKGQTETELSLPPGKYTLQLLLGNHLHIPHQPPVISEKISITVK
jgi:hypothetical protein